MSGKTLLSAIAGVVVVLSAVGVADAAPRKKGQDRSGSVHTCSIYGHGCTTAPIRRGAHDYELRMPGGTWIRCRADCKTALREEVLDFWETQRERAGDNLN